MMSLPFSWVYWRMPSRTIVARQQRRKTGTSIILSFCRVHSTRQKWQAYRFQWQDHSETSPFPMPQAWPLQPHRRSTRGKWPVCLPSMRRICLRHSKTTEDTPWKAPRKTLCYEFWYRHQAFIWRCRLRPQESLERGISLPPYTQISRSYFPPDTDHVYQLCPGRWNY